MDIVVIVLDLVVILSILALCWNLLNRIEALERRATKTEAEQQRARLEAATAMERLRKLILNEGLAERYASEHRGRVRPDSSPPS